MRRFSNREDFSDLEAELRAGRPEPRDELMEEIVTRVARTPVRAPGRRPRFALAFAFVVVVLGVFASFGGVAYAKASVQHAAKSCAHVATAVVRRGSGGRDDRQTQGRTSNNNSNNSNPVNNGNPRNNDNPVNNGTRGDDNANALGDQAAARFQHGFGSPSTRQYSRFVFVCYPFRILVFRNHHFVFITVFTILVPRDLADALIPPGSRGPCGFGHH